MLEVIDKGSVTEAHPVPLLFVHGGYHAAWCWDQHFLDFFADKGFRAVAVSLRGHGRSTRSKPIRSCSIADYVDDVRTAAGGLDSEPVLVGHSMGGFIVQKYLEKYHAPAAVLMASMPPQGVLRVTFGALRRHPWTFMRANTFGNPAELMNTPDRAREFLFSPYTPAPIVEACAARLCPESRRAGIDQMTRLPKPHLVSGPLLVLGAQDDGTLTNAEAIATARSYQTTVEFFPNMGHNMMLEPEWQKVAERIAGWLIGRKL
jgi:pimeloyl-ACP methyl ester carboxylesterase